MSEHRLEELFERIEKVAGKMEDVDVSLEESFELYHEGMKLLKQCNEIIDAVEKKVQILDENGETHEF
ncbi:MAG: exodeoxyribonuclease VII small subunit [Candidatus Ruminococcus intestinipullorum]|nr:exodeoxyribonuclease VII small subunit [Candidatus Ruminococcus intestinipullorum]